MKTISSLKNRDSTICQLASRICSSEDFLSSSNIFLKKSVKSQAKIKPLTVSQTRISIKFLQLGEVSKRHEYKTTSLSVILTGRGEFLKWGEKEEIK